MQIPMEENSSFWLSVMNGLAALHVANNVNFIFDVAAETCCILFQRVSSCAELRRGRRFI